MSVMASSMRAASVRSGSVALRCTLALAATLLLVGCGGGGGAAGGERSAQQGGNAGTASSNCTGKCADTPTRLSATDVQQIIAQAVAEARARNDQATIAVVDRVGNVLAVFRMSRTNPNDDFVTITSSADGSRAVAGGLCVLRTWLCAGTETQRPDARSAPPAAARFRGL